MIGNAVNVHALRVILRQILKPEPVHGPQRKTESDRIYWRCPDKYCALKYAVIYEAEGNTQRKSARRTQHKILHNEWRTDEIWPWTKKMIDEGLRTRKRKHD